MTNPLLETSPLPYEAPQFDKIEEGHYLPAIEAAIKEARANIDAIKNNPDAPTFENTIVALETASENLDVITSIFEAQIEVCRTDNMHEIAQKVGPITSEFENDINLDPVLFERIKTVHDQKDTLNLTDEQNKLLEDTYKGFVRSGALLDESKKTRLREISERQSVLNPAYSQNSLKATEAFELIIDDENDLAGLPDSIIEAAQQEAESRNHKGKWVFTLDIPSLLPFLRYADNRDLREKIWRAYTTRAWKDDFDNSDNTLEIVRLRHERAQLLGYETHAHYVLEKRMAEKPKTVWDFLTKLKDGYKPRAIEELEELKQFARDRGGPDDIKQWDLIYYREKLREERYAFSEEELRPYFPLNNVLDGMFTHFSKLFQLRFEETTDFPTWHEDVKVYNVFDDSDGSFTGLLYADFYPRKGKRNGACMTQYRAQGLHHGNIEPSLTKIICNFPKPTGDKPSLLTHDDVKTLFHEMGHALHGLLSNVTYKSLSGVNVLWDFVELPSQVQENWTYQKETLDMFARHNETGETIPQNLIDKLNAAKNFMKGFDGLRQVNLSTLDMAWYTHSDPSTIHDVAAFEEDEKIADTSLFPCISGPMSTAFGHIFSGGYSAGYYSYKWAEVLAADAFELFLENGLYDRETAQSLKENILSRGATEHPQILYTRFRGRDADPKALLRKEGLEDDEPSTENRIDKPCPHPAFTIG